MTGEFPRLPASRVGPYQIDNRIGSGGMGVVYLGYHEATGAPAAVKVLRPEYVADQRFRDRLRREVAAARRVPRFCTAQVLGADLEADPPWVATEYIEAPSLDVVLLEHGKLAEADLEAFAVGVAMALHAIHQRGVVHRDLKPSNIMLSPFGPRVIDFGIARLEGADTRLGQLTPTGAVLGTPRYMAPEQRRGEPITTAVDVYAWGALVTCAATGQPPPGLDGLPGPLRGLVASALDPDPAARPPASALVDRLAAQAPEATTRVLATAALATAALAPALATAGPTLVTPGAALPTPDEDTVPVAVSPVPAGRRPTEPAIWSRRRVITMIGAAGAAATAAATLRWLPDDSDDRQIGAPLQGHTKPIGAVAVGELAGAPIAVSASGGDRRVRVWDLATGEQVTELVTATEDQVKSVAISYGHGHPVAVLGGTGTPSIQVWDLHSGERVELPFLDHTDSVHTAAVDSIAVFDWDGSTLAVSGSSADRTVRVWDLTTGDQVGESLPAYDPDESITPPVTVAAGVLDGTPAGVVAGSAASPWARVWDLGTRQPLAKLHGGHDSRVTCVTIGEVDGAPVVVSGSQDHSVRIWEPTTGQPIGPGLQGHDRYVSSVAFTELAGVPVAVSGSNDGTVRVWDLTAGEQLGPELVGHADAVTAVAVGQLDGAPIAVSAGGREKEYTLRRWLLPTPGSQ